MTPVIELRSDTFTLPTEKMLAAPLVAPLGDDGYGEDPTVAELERTAAALLGKESACLMPSGTMANLAALLSHCPRGGKAIVGQESDIYVYEAGGASVCGGVVYEPLPNRPDGTIDPAAVAAACAVDRDDPQFALPALICLETPQNRCGGTPLPLDHLAEVREVARRHGVPLHLDGARLFNAAVALGVAAADIARYADTVQVCLSKGLCAPVGSVLAGPRAVVERARRVRKMLGGGMRQAGVVAAAGTIALTEMTARLPDDHATARRLAGALADLPGLLVEPNPPATNMVFFRVRDDRYTTASLIAAAADRGVRVGELGHGRIRAVTHAGIRPADVDRAVRVFTDLLTPASVAGEADMTLPLPISRSNQAEGFSTAPQGNVTQASHKYVTEQNLLPNATNTFNSGEAELL
jgi:threonine aldolase